MADTKGFSLCSIVSWVVAAVAGIAAFWVTLGEVSFIAALMVGVALAAFLGLVLTRLFCMGGADAAAASMGTVAATGAAAGATVAQTAKSAAASVSEAAESAKDTAAEAVSEAGAVAQDSVETVQEAASETAETAADAAAEAKESVAETAQAAAVAVADTATDARDAAAETAAEAKDAVTETAQEAKETASEAVEDARDTLAGIERDDAYAGLDADSETASTASADPRDTLSGVERDDAYAGLDRDSEQAAYVETDEDATSSAAAQDLAALRGGVTSPAEAGEAPKGAPSGSTQATPDEGPAASAGSVATASGAVADGAEDIPDYDGDGVKEGEGEGAKPAMLAAPKGDGPDNLKEIKGVGPKLEQLLHSLGVFHFDQIAEWSDQEIAWMDANLKGFRGRVSRDAWVDQAKVLAAGGETEFSKRVDSGKVY